MAESYLLRSAVLRALYCERSEFLDELGVFRAVHYVGGSFVCCVDVSGACISVEVALEVFALADRGAGALDLEVEAIRAEVVAEVIGFGNFARESETNGLLGVLSVVCVIVQVLEAECGHLREPLSVSYIYIILPPE